MPALASLATEPEALLTPGMAHVTSAGGSGHGVTLLDARPPSHFTQREEDEALEKLAIDAGPATAGIVRRVSESFDAIRAELNERAGGQASSRVMTLAHNAQRAQLAVELQTTVSVSAHGRYVANGGDKGQAEKGLTKLVGICAFATDLLNKAYEAARAEHAANKGSATDQLMARLGHGVVAKLPTLSPDVGGGQVTSGTPSTVLPPQFPFPIPSGETK